MANGINLKFDAAHHVLGGLLVLEATLVLTIALVPLLILQR